MRAAEAMRLSQALEVTHVWLVTEKCLSLTDVGVCPSCQPGQVQQVGSQQVM